MALSKTIPTPTGTDATYWRVLRVDTDDLRRVVQITLGGFADGAASARVREADQGRPLDTRQYRFVGAEYDAFAAAEPHVYGTVGDAIAGAAYRAIKAQRVSAPNPDYDPTRPPSETNPRQVTVPGEFHDALDI